jgi:hypothetical protein
MELACVTAICGGYDTIIETHHNEDGAKFVCFTDNPSLRSNLWVTLPACNEFDGRWDAAVRNAKRHKVMIHEYINCEYSLWIDGNVMLIQPMTHILASFMRADCDIYFFKHPARDCAYDEMEICARLNLDDPDVMRNQLAKYEAEGFPRHYGLHAGGTILRRHTKQVAEFNRFWWNEICQHSKRDQLSLDYSIWKTGIEVGYLDDYWHSSFRMLNTKHE